MQIEADNRAVSPEAISPGEKQLDRSHRSDNQPRMETPKENRQQSLQINGSAPAVNLEN